MKLFNLIKSIPFISTLIVIIFLTINNQKEYTKLKILIWNTPTLSLGNYLAISVGTGYFLSYIVTSSQVKNIKTINATFRVIGNTNIKKQPLNNKESQDEYISDFDAESDYEYFDQKNDNQSDNKFYSILNDWEDDTYLNW